MYVITDEKKERIFIMCKEKDFVAVGYEFGLDKYYKTVPGMRTAVSRIYNSVKNDPEKFGLSYERANEVAVVVSGRQSSGLKNIKTGEAMPSTLREKNLIINPEDIKGLITGARNKAAKIMFDKLGRIERSKKATDDIGLGELAKVVGILFDKGQIIQGQSTENIAIMSKNIDANLTPEEALDAVLKMRETQMASQ